MGWADDGGSSSVVVRGTPRSTYAVVEVSLPTIQSIVILMSSWGSIHALWRCLLLTLWHNKLIRMCFSYWPVSFDYGIFVVRGLYNDQLLHDRSIVLCLIEKIVCWVGSRSGSADEGGVH